MNCGMPGQTCCVGRGCYGGGYCEGGTCHAPSARDPGECNSAADCPANQGCGGPFVCGAAFTLADVVLGLSTNRWRLTPIERPVLPAVEAETRSRFAAVEDLFTIRDLGGWAEAQRLLFDDNGIYDQALARGREENR